MANASGFCHPENPGSTHWSGCECHEKAHAEEVARLREALAPFCDPASYTTDEQECRRNPAMDWCAVHSFRWPCPVGPARAALAAAEKGVPNV